MTVTVDPCSGEVSVKAETEETVSQEAKRDATGFNDIGPSENEPARPREGATQAGPRQEVRAGAVPAPEQGDRATGEAPPGTPAGDFARSSTR